MKPVKTCLRIACLTAAVHANAEQLSAQDYDIADCMVHASIIGDRELLKDAEFMARNPALIRQRTARIRRALDEILVRYGDAPLRALLQVQFPQACRAIGLDPHRLKQAAR
jgi:hypothetical protein